MHEKRRYESIFLDTILIKEYCNLIGQEIQQVSSKLWSQVLPSLNDYVHENNLRYHLISCMDFDGQKILKFDWTRGTTPGRTQPKMVVIDATFP